MLSGYFFLGFVVFFVSTFVVPIIADGDGMFLGFGFLRLSWVVVKLVIKFDVLSIFCIQTCIIFMHRFCF